MTVLWEMVLQCLFTRHCYPKPLRELSTLTIYWNTRYPVLLLYILAWLLFSTWPMQEIYTLFLIQHLCLSLSMLWWGGLWIQPVRHCPVYWWPYRWLSSRMGLSLWPGRWRCKTPVVWSQPPQGTCQGPVDKRHNRLDFKREICNSNKAATIFDKKMGLEKCNHLQMYKQSYRCKDWPSLRSTL